MLTDQATVSPARFSILSLSVLLLYFVSGAVGLSYEILWAKALSLLFGVSIFGVAISVSAFLAGLGVGAISAYKLSPVLTKPLFLLGLIECGVAIFSFVLPSILSWLDSSLLVSGSGLFSWYAIQSIVTFSMLFFPATLLGFGFALLLKYFSSRDFSVGTIYGVNTFGGVVGVLLPLLLLPLFGWIVSLKLVAIFGFITGLAFILIGLRSGKIIAAINQENLLSTFRSNRMHVLAYSVVGFSSLVLQMAWTRFYGMIFLRTEYVLAVIISVFLLGIAMGSVLSRRLHYPPMARFFPFIIALFALLSLWLLPFISDLNAAQNYTSHFDALSSQAILLFAITFPTTFILGMWYPFLTRYLHFNAEQSVILYGFNSIGAGIGALTAVFLLLPLFDSARLIGISAALFLLAGMVWLDANRSRLFSLGASCLCLIFAFLPSVGQLLPMQYESSSDIFFSENAIAATHVVEKRHGERVLLNDLQRMDASTDYSAVQAQRNQARLPYLLHRSPHSMLFLGLGTGITASGVIPVSDLDVDIVELSSGAIQAAGSYFEKANLGVMSTYNIIQDDARRYLRSSTKSYDVIVGDLFHPDLVGRGNLLSSQQFSRVRARLNNDGVFTQWLALNQFDVHSLQVVLRTFAGVFPENMLFIDGFRLALVGVNGPPPSYAEIVAKFDDDSVVQALFDGETLLTWMGRYLGKMPVTEGVLQDDWFPVLEYWLPDLKFQKQFPMQAIFPYLFSSRPLAEEYVSRFKIPPAKQNNAMRTYVATEMLSQSILADLYGNSEKSFISLKQAFEANPMDRWVSFRVADELLTNPPSAVEKAEYLDKVLEIRPDHIAALSEIRQIAVVDGDMEKVSAVEARIRLLDPYYIFD